MKSSDPNCARSPPSTRGGPLSTRAERPGWRTSPAASRGAYPDFVELCEALTEKHYISLNSNMSNRSLLRFAGSIDPSRVSFINAGLHLDEREHRAGIDAFLRHAQELRAAGFRTLVSVVATPSVLERFDEAVKLLEPIGLFPIPKLMRGPFAGAVYPNAYTDADKSRFRTYSRLAREFYREMLARIDQPPSLGMLDDDAYVDAVPEFTGRIARRDASSSNSNRTATCFAAAARISRATCSTARSSGDLVRRRATARIAIISVTSTSLRKRLTYGPCRGNGGRGCVGIWPRVDGWSASPATDIMPALGFRSVRKMPTIHASSGFIRGFLAMGPMIAGTEPS
jgi:hypothetical protein